MIRRVGFALLAVLALVFLTATPRCALAQGPDHSVFVVANPQLRGDYQRTVILTAPFRDGHIGVILNRPTRVTMAELFPEDEASKNVSEPVYLGGLEGREGIFALIQGASPYPEAAELAPGVWFVFHGKVVDRILESTPNGARYFAGYVLWRPGELEAELRKGWFVVRPVDPEKIFSREPASLYDELAPKKGEVST